MNLALAKTSDISKVENSDFWPLIKECLYHRNLEMPIFVDFRNEAEKRKNTIPFLTGRQMSLQN